MVDILSAGTEELMTFHSSDSEDVDIDSDELTFHTSDDEDIDSYINARLLVSFNKVYSQYQKHTALVFNLTWIDPSLCDCFCQFALLKVSDFLKELLSVISQGTPYFSTI